MNQIEALRRIEGLGVEALTTRDASALLGVNPANAHMILRRLQQQGFLAHLARGRWALARKLKRALLPEHLATPDPAYLSLQSALFHHGLVEQIPAVLYAVTLGRARRVVTPSATVSFHHLPPELFTGFERMSDGANMATPEKALFDLLYLGPGRSRLFAQLPELHITSAFNWNEVKRIAARVKAESRRSYILSRATHLANSRPSLSSRAADRNTQHAPDPRVPAVRRLQRRGAAR